MIVLAEQKKASVRVAFIGKKEGRKSDIRVSRLSGSIQSGRSG